MGEEEEDNYPGKGLPRERVEETREVWVIIKYSISNFQTSAHGPLHTQFLCKCHLKSLASYGRITSQSN